MIIRVPMDYIEFKIKQFDELKIPYVMRTTNERTTLVAQPPWGTWQNRESSFKASELNFIKTVKSYILNNGVFSGVYADAEKQQLAMVNRLRMGNKVIINNFKADGSSKKIKYFYYNKKCRPGMELHDVYEVDLKNAYWDTAFKMGLFDQDIYNKGLQVSKKSRLAAIGTLAKRESVVVFNGKTYEQPPDIRSVQTEFLWHTISHKIGRLMAKAARRAGHDFLFFWVDAIFIRGHQREAVKALFKEAGYKYTEWPCEWVKFEEKGIKVHSEAKKKWITSTQVDKVMVDGKPMERRQKVQELRKVRPFPYTHSLTEAEIINLNQ